MAALFPRTVDTGLRADGRTEIRAGLNPGDDIVVSAQFLIDSESALRESFRKLERLQTPIAQITLDSTQQAMFDHMVDGALYVHQAISQGEKIEPKQLNPAVSVTGILLPAFKNTQMEPILINAETALKEIQAAATQSAVKAALAKLIKALEPWLLQGNPHHYAQKNIQLFEDKSTSGKWLQLAGKANNPFGQGDATKVPWPEKPMQLSEGKKPINPRTASPR